MIVGEVGRRPAADGRSDVLVGADDDCEYDEEQDCVAVVQSVDEVVVAARTRPRQLGDRRQHSIHRDASRCALARRRIDSRVLSQTIDLSVRRSAANKVSETDIRVCRKLLNASFNLAFNIH